jgi:hypothetical protein
MGLLAAICLLVCSAASLGMDFSRMAVSMGPGLTALTRMPGARARRVPAAAHAKHQAGASDPTRDPARQRIDQQVLIPRRHTEADHTHR